MSPADPSLSRRTIQVEAKDAAKGVAECESDALPLLTAEGLVRASYHLAAEPAIEADRALVVGQRPDDESSVSVAFEILAGRLEHPPAETAALAGRRQIELEDLPAIAERGHAVAPVADVADDAVAELEHEERRAARNRRAPPGRATAGDHPLELATRNDAAIGFAPRLVVHLGDIALVAQTGRADGDDRLDHASMLCPAAMPPQGLDRRGRDFFPGRPRIPARRRIRARFGA